MKRLRDIFGKRTPKPRFSSGCPYCGTEGEHRVFITNPAGWGSSMQCSPTALLNGVVITSLEEHRQMRAMRP